MHTHDPRLERLLQEILDSGEDPDVVCAHTPELLADVKARLARVRSLEDHLVQLLPERGASHDDSPERLRTLARKLPQIPGYEIESVLGFGGMGAVYRGRHLALNRTVAIKTLLAGSFASPRDLERFKREAESIAGLCHPNIVQVFDAGEYDGAPYFVMEYMAGGTLAHKLAGRPMPARAAAECAQLLARAVHTAHRAGIVHRDLKPSNILIGADGTMKVADFGVAGRAEPAGAARATLTGAAMGTPSYMAPEQASGKAAAFCPLVDVYALGAMLYEMLTGRPPFRDDSAAETMRQVIATEPVPPSRLNPAIPRDIDIICMKCLEKDASRRYDSATALADDLERALRAEPIHARPIGPARRAVRWTRRRPAQAALLGISLLVLGGLLGGGAWIGSRHQAMRASLGAELVDAEANQRAGDFGAASLALARARFNLTSSTPAELRSRLEAAEQNLGLVERLGALRMDRAASRHVRFDREHFWNRYHEEFLRAELLRAEDQPQEFGARVRASLISGALVDAMDDWAMCAFDRAKLAWLLDSTRAADPDPVWRDRVRDYRLWEDRAQLARLAAEAEVDRQSVPIMLMLAGLLGDSSIDFLREVQRTHASDFWANFTLAEALEAQGDADAAAFYQVALALRPRAVAPYVNLGNVLKARGERERAREYWMRAIEINPTSLAARENLAIELFETERFDECVAQCEAAIAADPDSITAYAVAGSALMRTGAYTRSAEFLREGLARGDGTSPNQRTMTVELERCERLIAMDARLPALLAGTETFDTSEEALEFATMCAQSHRYVAALACYELALAFSTGPQPAARSVATHNAACSAALAAIGSGKDASALDETARTKLRARARELILSNIELVRRTLPDQHADTRDMMVREVRAWRTDPDLRAIRDETFVSAMSADERAACARVWKAYEEMVAEFRALEDAR